MNNAVTADTTLSAARHRVLYILAVASFPIALTSLLVLMVMVSGLVKPVEVVGHKTEFAKFNYPTPGVLVGENFKVQGEIQSVPADEVVYLVESVDGLFWPKQRLGASPGSFSREQKTTAGEGYKYTIKLLSLNSEADAVINQWYEDANKSGKYPGIGNIEGARTLATVRVIRQ